MDAFAKLLILFRILILTPQGDLNPSLSLSQPVEHYYEYESSRPDTPSTSTSLRRKVLVSGQTTPILILFDALSDERKFFFMGPANLTDEIERLMEVDSWQRRLITGSTARRMSNVVVVGEIHSHLENHQPRIQMPKELTACVDDVQNYHPQYRDQTTTFRAAIRASPPTNLPLIRPRSPTPPLILLPQSKVQTVRLLYSLAC